jgi:hypothetical protein
MRVVETRRPEAVAVRTMFLVYLVFITAGITYFTIIGLTHH